MGAQFLKCPPQDPVHFEFLRRIGKLFDIDLTCKLTPAYYLILNQFEWVFPSARSPTPPHLCGASTERQPARALTHP